LIITELSLIEIKLEALKIQDGKI